MNRAEFIAAVCSVMRRATADERTAIQKELEEHLEDRMDALLEPEEPALTWLEAESQAVAAMGDPTEIGRALDRQFSPGWLWLGRIAALLAVLLSVQMLISLGVLIHAWSSLTARIYPNLEMEGGLAEPEISERVNLRMDAGNDVIRVYQVSVGRGLGDCQVAEVQLCAYDRWPFGIVAENIWNDVFINSEKSYGFSGDWGGVYQKEYTIQEDGTPQGPDAKWTGYGHGYSNFGALYWQVYTTIQEGDESVLLTYERFGETSELEVPLPKQEALP